MSLELLVEYQAYTYIHVSSASLLVTDWFFTLELEAAYAWNPPWNMGTVLFFLTRYLVFIDTFISLYRQLTSAESVNVCTPLYTIEGWLISFGIIIAELILTIRVWALWERTRNIKIVLIVISIINALAGIIGYVFYNTHSLIPNKTASPVPTVPACFDKNTITALQWAYAALLVHQTMISIMTVVKGVQHYRMGSYKTSLIYTFYKDGVSYYVVMIALSTANIVMLHKESAYLVSIQRVLHSLLTARMLLNLRQEACTLHVRGQNSQSSASKLNIVRGDTTPGWTKPGVIPRNQQSRVEGWFGNQELPAHQRCVRMDLEA